MAIEVQVVSNSQSARQDLAQLSKSVDNIGKSVEKTSTQLKSFATNLITSFVSAAAISSMIKMSDAITTLDTKLKIAAEGLGDFSDAMKTVRKTSLDTRNDLATIGTLYSKLAMSAKALGVDQKSVGIVTANVAKSLAISGSTIGEAQAAILQLGQAMASGRLQGDELRSILENAPQLGQAIADGLGVAIGDLRKLGEAGALTSDLVFAAILDGTDAIDARFKNVGITFAQAFTNVSNAFTILSTNIKNFGSLTAFDDQTAGQSRTLAQMINDAALGMAKFANNFEYEVLHMRTSFWLFVNDVGLGMEAIPKAFEKAIGAGKNSVVGKLTKAFDWLAKIDLSKYIPTMGPMLEFIKNWTVKAERAFFWLYDRVIGHSWIPDLVIGVTTWMAKLGGGPLDSVMSFAKKVEGIFKNMLDKVIQVPFISDFIKQVEILKAKLDDTSFMRNVRQVLGMKETKAGTYSSRAIAGGLAAYDTNAFVGRGPMRNSADRGFMHDLTNSFKSENQIPFLAAVSSTIGTGLIVALESGSVIKGFAAAIGVGLLNGVGGFIHHLIPVGGLLASGFLASIAGGTGTKILAAVITTAFGLAVGKYVNNQEIKLTTASITKAFIDGMQGAVKVLFGSGIFGDRGFGGTLAMIAKLALLFSAGREKLGKMAIGVATVPMKLTDAISDVLQKKAADSAAVKADQKASKLMSDHTAKMSEYSKSVRKELGNFSKIIDAQGNAMGKTGTREMMKIIKAGDPLKFKDATDKLGYQGRVAATNLRAAVETFKNEREHTSRVLGVSNELKASSASLKSTSEALGKRIAETREAARLGLNNVAGSIGGIFGTLAGFNIGGKIAEQMVGFSDWAKIGVQIGASMIGQGIGAAIGQGIARTMLLGVGLLTSPITLAIAAGAAIIFAAYKSWEEPGWLDKQLEKWKGIANDWAVILTKALFGDKAVKDAQTGAQIIGGDGQSDSAIAGTLFKALGEKLKTYLPDSKSFKDFGEKFLDIFVSTAQAAEADSVQRSPFPGAAAALTRATDNAIAKVSGVVTENETNFSKLVEAIRGRETGGLKDPAGAVSPDKAYGSMQITEDTFNRFAKAGEKFTNETDRIAAATRYLRKLWEQTGGDVKKSAAMYIGGDSPTKGGVLPTGELRDFGPDSLGTTPKAYAEQVYARFQGTKSEATTYIDKFKTGMDDLYQIYEKDGISGLAKHLMKMVGVLEEEKKSVTPLADAVVSAKDAEETLIAFNNAFKDIGVAALSMRELETLSAEDMQNIERLIVDFYETQSKLMTNVSFAAKRGLNAVNEANKRALINTRKQVKSTVEAEDSAFSITEFKNAQAWADQAWKNINTALSDGLYKAIKGETTFSEFANNFGQAVLNTIVEGLTKGLAQQLLAPLETLFPQILKNVFNIGGMAGDAVTYPITKPIEAIRSSMSTGDVAAVSSGISGIPGLGWRSDLAEGSSEIAEVADESISAFKDSVQTGLEDMPSWFSNIWDTIKGGASSFMSGISSLMGSIGSGASGAMSWISGLFSAGAGVAAATGGSISGPGTGTSDSIPAMLSNGEYVINAKSAAKYGNILGAINNGTLSAFAEGGAVGSATPAVNADVGVSGATVAIPVTNVSSGGDAQLDAINAKLDGVSSQLVQVLNAIGGVNTNISNSTNQLSMMQGITNLQLGIMQLVNSLNQSSLMIELAAIMWGVNMLLMKPSFATGGYVSGPGTGTSDSIAANLSNGEYVVNAKATRKFGPLLEQINSGGELHFASGGPVGISAATALNPTLLSVSERKQEGQQQIFNINVTGDISRQTRREIADMMPQIATGVNMHNYEKNRKR